MLFPIDPTVKHQLANEWEEPTTTYKWTDNRLKFKTLGR